MDHKVALFEKNARPGGGPSANAPATRDQAVTFFEQIIAGLYEKDYGDFMRKCVLYIERLRVDVASGSPHVMAEITKMKMYTAYASDFDIENTRLRLLRDADAIRKML